MRDPHLRKVATLLPLFALLAACGEVTSDQGYEVASRGLTKGQPGAMLGDADYCYDPANRCEVGEGVCGNHSHCMPGLKCALKGEVYGLPGKRVCHPETCVNQRKDTGLGEIGVDCGGICGACPFPSACYNGVQDGTETAVDCGPGCEACVTVGLTVNSPMQEQLFATMQPRFAGSITSSSADQRANRRVDFLINGELIGSTLTATNGAWSFTAPAQSPGFYTLTVRVNNGGNITTLTRQYSVAAASGTPLFGLLQSGGAKTSVATRAVTTNGARDVIVAGVFSSQLRFGPVNGEVQTLAVSSPGTLTGFVASYTASGAPRWATRVAAASGPITIVDVAASPSGELYVLGDFTGSMDLGAGVVSAVGARDGFVMKLSSQGQRVWARALPATGGTGIRKLVVTPDGGVAVALNFTGTATFGGAPLVSAGGQDIAMVRLSAAGAHVWSQSFGAAALDSINDIAQDGQGNLYITGLFETSISFGDKPLNGIGTGNAYLAKFAPSGAISWSKDIGGASYDVGVRVAVDPLGEPVVGGYFEGDVNFGDGLRVTSTTDGYDLFLSRYNSLGQHLWSRQVQAQRPDNFSQLLIGPRGTVTAVGMHQGSVELGLGVRVAQGQSDGFIAVYASSGAPLRQRFLSSGRAVTPRAATVDALDTLLVAGDLTGPSAELGTGPLVNEALRAGFVALYQ